MKIQFLTGFVCLLFATIGSAQTTIFPKNQEIARYNEIKNSSKTVKHSFISTNPITNDEYELVCATMEEKDGMVACKRIGTHELEVTHEDWVHIHDIIGIIKVAVAVIEKPSTEPHQQLDSH